MTGVQKMVRSAAASSLPGGGLAAHRYQPIDMAHLEKQALGDKGLEGEVLRMFDQMSHVYYRRLETSTTVEDLLRHLHTLKGAAAGIGAKRIAELARMTEEELRAGKPVNPERIDDIGIAIQECSAFIGGLLEHQAA